jgi:3-deoxy-D-manno-octulosonate 8-phosphate phosphatase (KDO 8-P phosphatase)
MRDGETPGGTKEPEGGASGAGRPGGTGGGGPPDTVLPSAPRTVRIGAGDPVAPESELPSPATMARELIREPIHGPVRIIFLDLDGTLSDGVIGVSVESEFRNFWVRDGIALQWARDLGVLPVVISGRSSKAAARRVEEDLRIEYHEGVEDKVAVAEQVLKREGARWEECVMVGDDLPDVALMKRVGWPIAVGNAQPEVQLAAKTVLGTQGGRGAVREMVEMVLRHNGTWIEVLRRYGAA